MNLKVKKYFQKLKMKMKVKKSEDMKAQSLLTEDIWDEKKSKKLNLIYDNSYLFKEEIKKIFFLIIYN